ncbi:hypothetical protein AVEN_83998-1 [Araneus ventricosus]|uniref:Uncharacterized protein n=1 Tax=Araneus ventricosus TaxID=182803 RepID=A0A4Y2BTB4_ARAVE|nr:hypothetical protein AVEN_83998-1 [Araneus ventricosus]
MDKDSSGLLSAAPQLTTLDAYISMKKETCMKCNSRAMFLQQFLQCSAFSTVKAVADPLLLYQQYLINYLCCSPGSQLRRL